MRQPAPLTGRRGTTLIEALLALAVGGVLMAAVAWLLARGLRADGLVRRRRAARTAARAAADALARELEPLSAAGGDLVRATDSSIVLRAQRAFGFVCAVGPGPTLVLEDLRLALSRNPDPARDSVLVWSDGDPLRAADDGWVPAGLDAVAATTCDGGEPATALSLAAGDPRLGGLVAGAPVRTFETVEYRSYRGGDGLWWLGSRTAMAAGWTVTSPVTGPLAARGLRLRYLDAALAPVSSVESSAVVEVSVASRVGPAADSLVILVGVRGR